MSEEDALVDGEGEAVLGIKADILPGRQLIRASVQHAGCPQEHGDFGQGILGQMDFGGLNVGLASKESVW